MRRVLGTAHTSPGLQVCAGRKICRPAKNRATRAPAMKSGRYGSSLVRLPIHAPLKPNATRTRGPRQHVEARMAAKPPIKSRARSPLLGAFFAPRIITVFASEIFIGQVSLKVLDYLRECALELAQRFFSLARAHALSDASLHVVFQQASCRLVQRRTHRRKLNEQVCARGMLRQHALYTAHVSLNAAQPILKVLFNFGIKVDTLRYQ